MNKALLIKEIAIQAGISVEEATKPDKNSYELLVDSLSEYVTPEDDLLYEEPLWVRNQQNKTFKRGKQ